jgi:hypothetical protein
MSEKMSVEDMRRICFGSSSDSESEAEDAVNVDEQVHIPGPHDQEEAPSKDGRRVSPLKEKLADAARKRVPEVVADSHVTAQPSSAANPPTGTVAPTKRVFLLRRLVDARERIRARNAQYSPPLSTPRDDDDVSVVASWPAKRPHAGESDSFVRAKAPRVLAPNSQVTAPARQVHADGPEANFVVDRRPAQRADLIMSELTGKMDRMKIDFERAIEKNAAKVSEDVSNQSADVVAKMKQQMNEMMRVIESFEKNQDKISKLMFDVFVIFEKKLEDVESLMTDFDGKVATKDDVTEEIDKIFKFLRNKRANASNADAGQQPRGSRDHPGEVTCYFCKEVGHKQTECPQKKCYHCQGHGHRQRSCPVASARHAGAQ